MTGEGPSERGVRYCCSHSSERFDRIL